MKKKIIGFAIVLTTLAGIALASGTTRTRTDEVTGSDGGPVTFPAGLTNAGALTQTGAVTLSGTPTTVSSAVTNISSADLNITSADFDISGADTTISSAVANISSADLNITSADFDISGADTTISSATTLLSGTTTTISGTTVLSGATSATGGLTVPTAAATGAVHSFTAALTLTAGTNVAAVVTPTTFQYFQLGNSIFAYGQASIDPTSDDTDTVFTLSLPVARVNFTAVSQGTGTATKAIGEGGRCQATNSAQTVTCSYFSNGTAVELVDVWFVYTLP
jgi:hypothetical protein